VDGEYITKLECVEEMPSGKVIAWVAKYNENSAHLNDDEFMRFAEIAR
jgi:hypothetical protein